MIEVEHLVKRYRGAAQNAVDGIDFSVEAGELCALLGPNGAGKTTTIAILTTTLTPTAGSVRIAGVDVCRDPAAARRHSGVIFQQPSLDINLSGEENIRLHALLYGLYPYRPSYRLMPRAYRRQLSEMASVLGMEAQLFRPVRLLSGGLRRRLEIIRGLMHHPRVLFLDEPTTGLDAASRRALWAYLDERRGHHETTMVLTTHYLEEAEGAGLILVLTHGRITLQGSPGRIKARLGGERLVIDADDRDALRAELLRHGLPFEERDGFQVSLDGRSAYEIVRRLATPLTVLRTHQATLEDVYLRIVRDA